MIEWLEFKTFLFIYLANVDFDLSVEEEVYIKNGIEESIYLKQLEIFNSFSDLQAFNFILSHKSKFFETEAQKNLMLDEIKQFFQVDGDYSTLEKGSYLLFDKMM